MPAQAGAWHAPCPRATKQFSEMSKGISVLFYPGLTRCHYWFPPAFLLFRRTLPPSRTLAVPVAFVFLSVAWLPVSNFVLLLIILSAAIESQASYQLKRVQFRYVFFFYVLSADKSPRGVDRLECKTILMMNNST